MMTGIQRILYRLDHWRDEPAEELAPAAAEAIRELRDALHQAARNDSTKYRHHQSRPFDGKTPAEAGVSGTCWLTPREIAQDILCKPYFDTLGGVATSREAENG